LSDALHVCSVGFLQQQLQKCNKCLESRDIAAGRTRTSEENKGKIDVLEQDVIIASSREREGGMKNMYKFYFG
jgi:hypothetical protein